TDIARHRRVDLGVGRIGIALEKSYRRHDLARLAIAALNDFDIEPSLLDLGSAFGLADRFDGGDLLANNVGHGRDARADRTAVEVDGACSAQGNTTAELRSGQADDVAQYPQKWHVVRNIEVLRLTVDYQFRHRVTYWHGGCATDQLDTNFNDRSTSACRRSVSLGRSPRDTRPPRCRLQPAPGLVCWLLSGGVTRCCHFGTTREEALYQGQNRCRSAS